MPKTFLLQNNW